MNSTRSKSNLDREIHEFVRRGFSACFAQINGKFQTKGIWHGVREIGSEIWLDTGSIGEAEELWTQEFSGLTTNNTLLNREVQTGRYDSLVSEAAELLSAFPELTADERMLEIAFILNAWHGLRLVEKFDAHVSVEEHTGVAHDVERATAYARRYYAICPERFIIKLPLTPAGLLATRRISDEGIPVNHTLGFSARQNYVIARLGRPAYVNVFLGRLNSFVADNKLGDGRYVGEKATLASQAIITELRQRQQTPSRQIGASFRSGEQVRDLIGLDVMTIPPKVAGEFLSMGPAPDQINDKTGMDYRPGLKEDLDWDSVGLNTLWDVDEKLAAGLDALDKENVQSFTSDDLVDFFDNHDCADVLVRWSSSQIATSLAEGKTPRLENWRDGLADGSIGLDSLMNLAGLNSFATDQKAMDERVGGVLANLPQ